jgi:hypothetical protein
MSQPSAPLPVAAPPIEAAPADGAPYRVLAPPQDAPEPELFVAAGRRKPRPMLGPALSVFAALLWAFVIFGQLTTSWLLGTPLGPKTAALLVLLTTTVALFTGLQRSRLVAPPRSVWRLAWRGLGIAVLALLFFVVVYVTAAVAGNATPRNHDLLIAFVLVLLSTVAAIAGPPVTSPVPTERTHRQRVALVVVWVSGVLLTLVAGADLVANG